MAKFGTESLVNKATLHPKLQQLLDGAIRHVDFKIDCGHRSREAQHTAFLSGASEKDWPDSKHNTMPSEAADVILYYPVGQHIRWNEKENQYLFIGFLKGLAVSMGIKIRVGADWDGDFDIKDQRFNDLPHIEIILGG
jgi:peptidoglycan L-alanyl-D-glutamate endopeptidase CwlK